jgi:hypothetical protein
MVLAQLLESMRECIGLPGTAMHGRFRRPAAKFSLVMMQTEIERVPIHFVPVVNPMRVGQAARTWAGRENPHEVETPRLTDHVFNDRAGRIARAGILRDALSAIRTGHALNAPTAGRSGFNLAQGIFGKCRQTAAQPSHRLSQAVLVFGIFSAQGNHTRSMALALQKSNRRERSADMAWLTDRALIEAHKVRGFSPKLERPLGVMPRELGHRLSE